MKSYLTWKPATIAFVVLTITAVQLEPAAFGQDVNVSRQASAPNVQFNARQAVAQAVPHTQTAPGVVYHAYPPANQPVAKSKGKNNKKWIWIVAAAVGAGVTVAVLAHDNKTIDPAESPTITVGAPSVGQPQ